MRLARTLAVFLAVALSFAPVAFAVEGTLELKADVASFSGTFTQAGNQPIRTAFGPLRLDYKSGPNAWTTGLLIREGDGNVTIGAGITSSDFNATSKLRVLGTVESTTGGFKFPDGTTQTTAVSANAGLAQGSIVFYNGTSCPTGYNEVTGARGRTVVGLPAAGTLAGTVGTALTNLEDRTHTHTGPSHTHTYTDVIAHTHSVSMWLEGAGTAGRAILSTTNNYASQTSMSGAALTTGIATGTTAASGTGATGTAATSNVIPYVQYIVCEAASGAGSSGNGWNDLGSTVVLATTSDSVGIGTTSVTSKLTVAGTVESTTGGFKFPDGSTQTAAASGETSGQIAFFAAACPSGWTEYTALRGRYPVGNPLSGTLAGTSGTALSDLESRAVGQHNHAITDPGHSHGYNFLLGGSEGPYSAGSPNHRNQTAQTTGSSATGISINNSGSVAGTNAPYIQLTACQKN